MAAVVNLGAHANPLTLTLTLILTLTLRTGTRLKVTAWLKPGGSWKWSSL